MKIAIVGSGIAGLAASHALAGPHEVTVFEAAPRAGGHVYTVAADGHGIDMGFIVHNRERYPHFCALLRELAIETRPTAMAFSVADGELEWGSASLSAMFADRRTLASPRHWRFLSEVVGFLSRARRDLDSALVATTSLDEYLEARHVSRELRDHFVIPLAAALWSLAPERCGDFPAISYLAFLDQHGMLSALRPLEWRTIVGGSARYVDALVARLEGRGRFELALGTAVQAIARDAAGVTLLAGAQDDTARVRSNRGDDVSSAVPAGRERRFDRVIVATHADIALRLLADPSDAERTALGAFRYSRNRTVLHTDRAFLPRHPAAHAAWNYVADPDTARVAVTYSMTRLQGLPDMPYLVTLNPRREPAHVLHEVVLEHPQFDRAALAAQGQLARLSGTRHTFFAGAHLGFGFHEDGMRSGLTAAARLLAGANAAGPTGAA